MNITWNQFIGYKRCRRENQATNLQGENQTNERK